MFSSFRLGKFLAVFAASFILVGCGRETYPVTGQIEMKDGSSPKELAGYGISFDSHEMKVSAIGTIQADGSFELGTTKPNDGAKLGKYKVIISPPLSDNPDKQQTKSILLDRYSDLEKTDLSAVVEAKTNNFTFTVERAKRTKK